MSGITEQNYIMNISSQLEQFKTINPMKTYNFRCNICGDSDSRKHITRAYLFYAPSDDIFMFKCHNCGASYSFQHYLKIYFNSEYKDLRAQIFKERGIRQYAPKVKKEFKVDDIFDAEYQKQLTDILSATQEASIFTPILDLPITHKARKYLDSRKIPESGLARLNYTDNYNDFIRAVMPAEVLGQRKIPADPRIVFEFKTMDNESVGFQGRCIDKDSDLRFSILMLAETYPKMFGLDNIKKDSNETIFVTEGAIDSLFLPNCIALNGGDTTALNDIIIGEGVDKDRFIIILDNEPRSKDTYNRTKKTIEAGYKVVIWEGVSPEYKDINDMIINGIFTTETLKQYILNNTHKKTIAMLKLKHWTKY